MPITANSLYRDSFNFMRNQLVSISILSLLIAFISIILAQAFSPEITVQDLTNLEANMAGGANPDLVQQQSNQLLGKLVPPLLISIVTTALFAGSLLSLIQLTSQGHRVSALRALGASAPMLPRLLLLFTLSILLAVIGAMLFFIPGVIIAILLSMAPIVLMVEKNDIFAAFKQSYKLVISNLGLILPILLFWAAAKLFIFFIALKVGALSTAVTVTVMAALSNLVTAFVLVYLFRLYTQLRK